MCFPYFFVQITLNVYDQGEVVMIYNNFIKKVVF